MTTSGPGPAEALRAQLASTVTSSLEQFANNLAYVIQANPQGTITDVLDDRPDVRQSLMASLASARSAARTALAQAYPGQDITSPLYQSLIADIDDAYAHAPSQIRHALLQVFHAHPDVQFQPGIHTPGENPSSHAALERAQAARSVISALGSSLALRNGLSVHVADAGGRTEALLADAPPGSYKRWRASMDGKDPRSCAWCRALHGTSVPVTVQFPHPSQIGTHKPPKLYMGVLPGPPLHPNCRCEIDILDAEPQPPVGLQPTALRSTTLMLSSEDVASLPTERYQQLRHFLSAALHELGQILSRLISTRPGV